MNQSEQIADLSSALAKAQGAMKPAVFNRINPHFKNRYADIAAVWDSVREPLSKNGLSVTQTMERMGEGPDKELVLATTLRHSSGQWVVSYQPLPSGVRPQEFGAALTYARRYSLSALVGIASEEDEDANATQQKAKPKVSMQPISEVQFTKLQALMGDDETLAALVENKWCKELGCTLETFPASQLAGLVNSIKTYKENRT